MNSEIIKERISKVRKIMEREGVDVYVVVTGDYHQSEYAGEYFSERKFITGFTGSAGTFVLGKDSAALFTDGRYFVQAEKQIENTGICLMRVGVEGVKNLYEYCGDILPQNGVLGFDGRTVGAWQGIKMSELADIKNASCRSDFDAIDEIFTDRPAFPDSRAFYLDEKYSGRSIEEKLELVRMEMKLLHSIISIKHQKKENVVLLSTLHMLNIVQIRDIMHMLTVQDMLIMLKT